MQLADQAPIIVHGGFASKFAQRVPGAKRIAPVADDSQDGFPNPTETVMRTNLQIRPTVADTHWVAPRFKIETTLVPSDAYGQSTKARNRAINPLPESIR